jgi:hypothetical protein
VPVSLPPEMPNDFVSSAYLGKNEAAWPPRIAAEVVDWLGEHGFAVFGAEVWIITRDGEIGTFFRDAHGRESIWAVAVDPKQDEPWSSFVRRAAASVSDSIRRLDIAGIRESGEVYVNITYDSQVRGQQMSDS